MPRIEPIPWNELPRSEREMIEKGMAAGAFTDPLPLQIFAYAAHEDVPEDGDRHPNFPRHLLPGSILELVRIRSAQLGGCEPCQASRKAAAATEETVACLIDPSMRRDLDDRQRLALEFLERLEGDHHSIDNAFYGSLAEHYTTAEIVELGLACASSIGMHRFLHTLDVFGDADPAIRYDPAQVGTTRAQMAKGEGG